MKILLIVFLSLSNLLFAQNFIITGKIINSENEEVLRGANIFIKELKLGTISYDGGKFSISNIPGGEYDLRVSYVGFITKIVKINLVKNSFIEVKLLPTSIKMKETIVKGKRAKIRETPVAFSNVKSLKIENELGSRYLTSSLENLPSLFISDEGGGFADSRINIRGYDQTSISVMINGIPINNPENGEIYWSNWADISDVVSNIQVQRGLSATPYSVSSVGGVVNVITRPGFGNGESLNISSQFASDNYRKISTSFSANLKKDKIRLIGMVSSAKWSGYADQTWAEMFSYYLSLGMILGNHSLEFQFLGSPQEHGQRITPQTTNVLASRGLRYNSDWGYLNGKPLNARDNKFHKPSLTINHIWEINSKTVLTNVVYLSHGRGGGSVPPWGGFETDKEGLIDFDKIWERNSNNVDSVFSTDLNRASSALRFTYHIHNWMAYRSTLNKKVRNFSFTAGIDGKFYYAQNYSTLGNLLGGDYYIGSGNVNQEPSTLLMVGEKVDYDADSYVRSIGGFGQIEYNNSNINAYLNFALTTTGYNRIDFFNYKNNDPKRETGWKAFDTYTVKAGINFNIDLKNNIYFNIGNFSKAPLSMNVYTYTNELFSEVKNENIFSSEFGYGFNSDFAKFNINLFYTLWTDKVLNFNVFMQDTYTFFHANVYGGKALHKGLEAEGSIKIFDNLSMIGSFSLASYKWLNDVKSYLTPEGNPNSIIVFDSKINGLYEGDAPMTKLDLGFTFQKQISKLAKFYLSANYLFYGRYFSQFDPVSRSFNNVDNIQSWRIPDSYTIDIHTGVSIAPESKIFDTISFKLNVFNILNNRNIIQAIDGAKHDINSALVWYNRERWVSGTISIDF